MANVEVTNFFLTVDEVQIDTVTNMLLAKIRLEYKGAQDGIHSGDKITMKIDNSASTILSLIGFGTNTVNIHGDGNIGKVGTRTYKNENGDFYLDVEFDNGYNAHFGGHMPDNIEGWLETSVYIQYKTWVKEATTATVKAEINGISLNLAIHAQPGGEPGPEKLLDTPGAIIGKSGRYGDHSGNLYDLPEVSSGDFTKFDPMRWSIKVGFQNLTWRDLRASSGAFYYTTDDALTYSQLNPTDERYQSGTESYLMPYAVQLGYPIDAPFHYENCEIHDTLLTGLTNGAIASAHEYIQDSLRIIRIMGREENNAWWGADAFRFLADSNFLKPDPDEPIDRFLSDIYFKGNRGLTINEFLAQLQHEGQLIGLDVSDILTFTADGFTLKLGNLHFANDIPHTVDIVCCENTTPFSEVFASNLPYGYYIYYDTKATEAILSEDGFHYNNQSELRHDGDTATVYSTGLWVKLDDDSGGGGDDPEPEPEPDPKSCPSICKAVLEVIESIAKQEVALASVIQAEADKLQAIIKKDCTSKELLEANKSVTKLIESVTLLEIGLHAKLTALPIEKCLPKGDKPCPKPPSPTPSYPTANNSTPS